MSLQLRQPFDITNTSSAFNANIHDIISKGWMYIDKRVTDTDDAKYMKASLVNRFYDMAWGSDHYLAYVFDGIESAVDQTDPGTLQEFFQI